MDKNVEHVLSQLLDRFLVREYFRPNQSSLTMKLLAAPYCVRVTHTQCVARKFGVFYDHKIMTRVTYSV